MERVRRLRMVSQAIPGRPRVAVLPHYEGTPSVAGRGRTNAGESLRDHGVKAPVRPLRMVPKPKIAAVERREARHPHLGMPTACKRASPVSLARRD